MKKIMKSLFEIRIKILAFVLILSVFGTVHATTRTKFVSYVNAYSVAEAGDFYFGSNLLATTEEGMRYSINNWDQRQYSVSIQVWNYENSLLYNEEEVSFYYKVDAVMYTDEACTTVDSNFVAIIEYEENVETIEVEVANEDGTTSTETYAYMAGTSGYDKVNGSQQVSVGMEATATVNTERYMKVTATTVPIIDGEIAVQEAGTEESVSNDYSYGVFESSLEATFELLEVSGTAEISTRLAQSDLNAQVQLRITCDEIANATSLKVRVYYKPSVLEADVVTMGSGTASTTYTGYNYAEFSVNAESITTVYLWKLGAGTVDMGTSTSNMGDVYVEVVN